MLSNQLSICSDFFNLKRDKLIVIRVLVLFLTVELIEFFRTNSLEYRPTSSDFWIHGCDGLHCYMHLLHLVCELRSVSMTEKVFLASGLLIGPVVVQSSTSSLSRPVCKTRRDGKMYLVKDISSASG